MMKIIGSADGNYVEMTVFLHHKTEKAILVSTDEKYKVWIPISCIEDIGEPILTGETPEVEITIKEWLAIQKELV